MKKNLKNKINENLTKLGWLDTVALIICFWFLLFPHPYKIAFTAVLVLPVLGLILNGVTRPSLSSLVTISKNQKYDLAEFIQLPAWILLLRMLLDYEYESFYSLIKVGTAGFCFLLLILVATHKYIASSDKNNWEIYLLIIGNIALYSYAATYGINCVFDTSDAKIYNAQVISKHISGTKHRTYNLKVEPWGNHYDAEDISVCSEDYNKIEPGQTVEIDYKQGLFGIPWYYVNGEAEFGMKNSSGLKDSLSQVIKENGKDTNKVNELYSLSFEYIDSEEYDSAIYYASQALTLSDQLHFDLGKARAFSCLGMANSEKENYDSALVYHEHALKILKKLQYRKGISSTFNNIGSVYRYKRDYPQAIRYYEMALKIREEDGDKIDIAGSHTNLGILYSKKGDKSKCIKCYLTGIKLLEQTTDKISLARAYRLIGDFYYDEKNIMEYPKYYAKESALKKDTALFKAIP